MQPNKFQVEKCSVLINWKNLFCQNVPSNTQVHIFWNLNRPEESSNLKQYEQNGRHQVWWPSSTIKTKRKWCMHRYRPIEKNRAVRHKVIDMWVPNIWQRCQEHTIKDSFFNELYCMDKHGKLSVKMGTISSFWTNTKIKTSAFATQK